MSSSKPIISGFTIIRNGIEYDYPFRESILSLLPLVDEFIINVGKGTDETLAAIQSLSQSHPEGQKIKIFESHWPLDDPEQRRGGRILADQTNLALERCQGDWCIYLQADEVLHEADTAKITSAIRKANESTEAEGLLFRYIHFYGSYDVIQSSRGAYRNEVRAFKRSSGARSVGDAQSFRKQDGSKLKVIQSKARIFHYGWVRTPDAMLEKTRFMDQLYHGKQEDGALVPHSGDNYRYKRFWGLKPFRETHPKIMEGRIQQKGWHWDLERSKFVWKLSDIKKVLSDGFEALTGIRPFEYRSYQLIDASRIAISAHSSLPRASLILATYEMPKHLELVLAALARQSTEDYEILICDDGSGSETRQTISFYKKLLPVKLTHLWQENKGFRKSKILNQAIAKAKGETLIFLDGDCVPYPQFIEDHIKQQEEGCYLCGRRVELGPEISKGIQVEAVEAGFFDRPNFKILSSCIKGDSTHFQRTLRISWKPLRRLLKLDRVVDLKGCNYSVSRRDMLAIDGYDESYEGYGREDTDVEMRLQNLGLKIKSLKGLALQYHVWHPRRAFTPANDDLLNTVQKEKRIKSIRGLSANP